MSPTRQRAPGLLRMALELRMPLEFAASVAALPFLMSGPRGDGHTVLVILAWLRLTFQHALCVIISEVWATTHRSGTWDGTLAQDLVY